jgi:hypothetical protein
MVKAVLLMQMMAYNLISIIDLFRAKEVIV